MPANRRRKPRRSNPGLSLSRDTLFELPGIVSPDEAEELIRAINNETYRQWSPEGYDRRNRVQRFAPLGRVDAGKKSMEDVFGWIFDRIAAAAALPSQAELKRPAEVVVVEHTATSCQSRVNTFEQLQLTSPGDSSSYVATLVLLNDCIYHIEKPARRDAECWDVAHPVDKYSSNIVMGRNSVVFKTGESLWEWRGRYVGIQPIDDSPSEGSDGNDGNDVDVLAKAWKTKKKLKTFKERWITVSFRFFEETPGQDPAMHLPVEQLEKTGRPPHHLPDLLTVIVTTSPVRSNPSTALLEQTFSTFFHAGKGFLECPKVVICDGCRILEGEEKKDDGEESGAGCPPKVTRKYSNIKQNLRNGIASTDQASNYTEFKRRLREICCEADVSSPFFNTSVVELEERQGYGFALRHALRHCVSTPYVCVIQHDRTFMRETPIDEVIQVMLSNPGVKYVGINQKSNLNYVDIFSGKYGRRAVEEYKSMILRPPQLNIGGGIYGPSGTSANGIEFDTEKRRQNVRSQRETYKGTHQFLTQEEWVKSNLHLQADGRHQLSLSPTIFWYDNTHVVSTSHYRDFIFDPQYKMVARGGFVEDKLSPAIVRSCERLGLRDGHAKFGCYILDDHSGVTFTGHLDGGSFGSRSEHT
mmetsp:Transcript_32773/g.73712  ORF Transcript_32773/g.73712 Transcript_32773/m.73712 type:complete len:641 (+) Transcript_32773:56-1978(+)